MLESRKKIKEEREYSALLWSYIFHGYDKIDKERMMKFRKENKNKIFEFIKKNEERLNNDIFNNEHYTKKYNININDEDGIILREKPKEI